MADEGVLDFGGTMTGGTDGGIFGNLFNSFGNFFGGGRTQAAAAGADPNNPSGLDPIKTLQAAAARNPGGVIGTNALLGLGMGMMSSRDPNEAWGAAMKGFMQGSQADAAQALKNMEAQKQRAAQLAQIGYLQSRAGDPNFTKQQQWAVAMDPSVATGTEKSAMETRVLKPDDTLSLYGQQPGAPGSKSYTMPPAPKMEPFFNPETRQMENRVVQLPRPGQLPAGGYPLPQYSQGPDGKLQQTNMLKSGPTIEDIGGIRKEITALPEVKRYSEAYTAYTTMNRMAQSNSAAGDLAFIYGVAKVFDPDSVVREGEMKMSQQAQSGLERVLGDLRRVVYGGERLSPEAKSRILDVVEAKMQELKGSSDARIDPYKGIAGRANIRVEDIMPGLKDLPERPKLPGDETKADAKEGDVVYNRATKQRMILRNGTWMPLP